MELGFRGRLVLGVTTLVVAFAGAALAVLGELGNQFVATQIRRQVAECRGSFERQMELRLASWRRETEMFAGDPRLALLVDEPDANAAAARLEALQAPLVALLTPAGEVCASRGAWPVGTDLAAMPGVDTARAGSTVDHAWPIGGGLALVAIAPLHRHGALTGMLVRGERAGDGLAATMGTVAGRDVMFALGGTVLAASWRSGLPDTSDLTPLLQLRHHTLPTTGQTVAPLVDGQPRTGLAVPLHRDGGIAWLSYDLQQVEALREQVFEWLLLTCGVLALLGVAFAVRNAARLTRPLRALTGAADRMARGDLEARVEARGMDVELGHMARSFNAMAATVQTLVRDVTDKAARAEAGNRAKDAFLTTMSHELRTPLTGIQSTAALLQQFGDETSATERAEFLDTILRESERLAQRIGSVLEFANLASGEVRWTLGRTSLLQVCEQACRRLAALLALKHVDFHVVCAPDAVLRGDREHLTQALYHLLHNAWTWSPADGEVDVAVGEVPGGYVIEVADRGPGVPAHERQRLFDSFTQGGDVLVDKPQGIGIGLKIAAEVADVHGGTIDYADRPGGGACFRMLVRCEDRPIDRLGTAAAAHANA